MRGLAVPLLLVSLPHLLAGQAVEIGFLNRNLSVGSRTYRYQVYIPPSYTSSRRWPVILFLHGGGERGDDGLLQTQVGLGAAIRKNPARFPAIVVFPQAPPDSFWAGTPARVAMAALDRTAEEFDIVFHTTVQHHQIPRGKPVLPACGMEPYVSVQNLYRDGTPRSMGRDFPTRSYHDEYHPERTVLDQGPGVAPAPLQ